MLASVALDVVIVATPDHWHALPAIAAMQAGADLYLEKPVGVDVLEGEALVAAARKYNRVVQVNTQRRSSLLYLEAREKYIASGLAAGKIGLVEMYSYLPVPLRAGVPGPIPDAPVPCPPKLRLVDRASAVAALQGSDGGARLARVHGIRQRPHRQPRGAHDRQGALAAGRSGVARVGLFLGRQIRLQGFLFKSLRHAEGRFPLYPGLDLSWEHRMWGRSPIPQRHWSDQWGARFVGEKGTLNMTMLEYVFTPADGGPREGVHMLSKKPAISRTSISADRIPPTLRPRTGTA